MAEATLTIAQLGCGYWGPNLLRNFTAQRSCRVKWVAEQSPKRRAYVEQLYPAVATTDDAQAVFADPEVQAVIVATPASTHAGLVRAGLQAGKHVFVEKPLAMNVGDANELAGLAQAKGLVLMVGHTFLYNGAVRYIKRQLDEGRLGKVYYLYSQRLNLGQVRTDVNAWWNLAPHDVSILLYLLNDKLPIQVCAKGVSHIQPGIEDVVFATLEWEGGVTAHIQVSWLDPGKVRRMTIVGSRQMLVYDDVSDDKITIYDKGVDKVPRVGERMDYDRPDHFQLMHRSGDILLPKVECPEPLQVEAEHFLHCVRTGATPITGPRHARDVVAVLAAGSRSLQNNGQAAAVSRE